jgi:hypothetical protein
METDLAQLAHDRFEIADALHRYAFGLDHGDADSLASAVTDDCRFDFRPAGRKLEIDFPLLTGRDAILNGVLPFIGPLDTSHSVSNLQIEIVDDTSYVVCLRFVAAFPAAGGFAPWIGIRVIDESLRLQSDARWR